MELGAVMKQLRMAVQAHRSVNGSVVDSRSLFAAIDADSSGTLSPDEFRRALMRLDLTQYGWDVSDEDLSALVGAMDTNGDGVIDWAEFLAASGLDDPGHTSAEAAIRKEQARLRLQQSMVADARAPLDHPDAQTLALLFKRMDYNGNGQLSLAEIDRSVHEFWPGMDHRHPLMRAYRAADLNSDGFIGKKVPFYALLYTVCILFADCFTLICAVFVLFCAVSCADCHANHDGFDRSSPS